MRKGWKPVLAAAAVVLAITGCTSAPTSTTSAGSGSAKVLTVWTVEDVAERVATQQKILDAYTAKTGVQTKLVAVAEDQLATVLASAAAANDLPDVIGAVSMNGINQLATDKLLDTDAAAKIVNDLGASTFSPRALELLKDGDTQLAVPSDGWAQLLFYRKDLFDAAGLAAPTTYDAIAKAAQALDNGKMAGIVASTAAADSFTQQTFEHFALANNCQLVTGDQITLNSPACQESLKFYADLIKQYSTSGAQDADTTRATYFAGDAAMVVWSSFLLDELAGLRKDALPTCDKCTDDPKWLAKNTGVVSAIQGPNGTEPASFGEIVSWAVLTGADPDTTGLVEYMMNDGYVDWLSVAAEGKVPTRFGTADEPAKFTDAWKQLKTGVDTKELLSDTYSAEILAAVAAAPNGFNRWGLPQGKGALAAAVANQFVIPKILNEMWDSGLSPADAAAKAQEQAQAISDELG
ncbi:MAG: extracellular solute-binding protein [Actinobacteria bacterium]|nr:extracellular solute-binding protein [Actinomycetota bacterium]